MLASALVYTGSLFAESAPVRIGTYDNRVIALAYYRSALYKQVLETKMAAYETALAEGNTAKASSLKTWGEQSQALAHRQTFGRYPVHELLRQVSDQLPLVCKNESVEAIVWQCDGTADTVELVDVSLALAELFDPDAATLKTIENIRKKPPIDLDVIESHTH